MSDRIWITWENQRRSRELATFFGCKLFVITATGILRYPKCVYRTLVVLVLSRPRVVFAQNPSMVLATIVVLWSKVSNAVAIVDRHTTFLLNRRNRLTPWLVVFRLMHWFTLRYANITIVTNEHLAQLVREQRGNPVVLPDRLPTLARSTAREYPIDRRKKNVLLISSFAEDEPIAAVVSAMSLIGSPKEVHLYVSGRVKSSFAGLVANAPSNITFTNYLTEDDYISLLLHVDVVMALSTSDHTMLCGCYEAVAAEKPLVTSDKAVLREYFTAALFADSSSEGIAVALDAALAESERRREMMRKLKADIGPSWSTEAKRLDRLVDAMSTR